LNTLIFEGAGWAKAEHNSVGNCRIRTRIRNKDGRLIYLEMGVTQFSKTLVPKYAEGLNFVARIDDCHYCDAKWDSRRSRSKELNHLNLKHFEYTKENILAFVNENLNCSFDNIEVINEGLFVHGTEEPLCDCCEGNPKPFKEIEISINELEEIKPVVKRDRTAKYKLNWQETKNLPYIREWIESRYDGEQVKFKSYFFIAIFGWGENGIITDLAVTARESNFVHMSFPAEDIQTVIDAVKRSNRVTAAV